MVDEPRCWELDAPLVVADEGYGQGGAFREGLTERGIPYVVGARSDTAVLPETARRTAPAWSGTGPKPVPRYRDKPVAVRELALLSLTTNTTRAAIPRHGPHSVPVNQLVRRGCSTWRPPVGAGVRR
jgi:hypothetical protein